MTTYTNKGALVKVDLVDDGVLYTDVGCLTELTPPPRTKNKIDMTCVTDTASDFRDGIETESVATFRQPISNEAATQIDALYDAATRLNWQYIWTDGVNNLTYEFRAWVSGLVPVGGGGSDGALRDVELTRVGSITVTESAVT